MEPIFDWHTEEVQSVSQTPEQCSMFVGNFLFGSWRCENASTQHVTAACVHEHVAEFNLCARCAESPQPMYCNACTDSAEPHECLIRTIVTERVSS